MYGNHSMYICVHKHVYEYVGRCEEIYCMLCWCVHIVCPHSEHVRAHSPGSPWLKNKQTNHSLYYLLFSWLSPNAWREPHKWERLYFWVTVRSDVVHHARGGMAIGLTGHTMFIVQKAEGRQGVVPGSSTSRSTCSDSFLLVRVHLLKAFLPSKPALPAREPAFIQMSLEGEHSTLKAPPFPRPSARIVFES